MKRKPDNDWWNERVPGADGEPPVGPTPLQPLCPTRDTVTVVMPRSVWESHHGATSKMMRNADYVEVTSAEGERKVLKDRHGPSPRIIRPADPPKPLPPVIMTLEEMKAKNLKIIPGKPDPGICYEFEARPLSGGRKG